MKILKTVKETQNFIKKTRKDKTIGFVPTMGYFHEGHLSLIRQARRDNDTVVVSIFVNPAQFGPKEDFKRYPRSFKRDEKLAKKSGADAIFYPSVKEIYPDGYKTYVEVSDITERLCGRRRPGHFKGVATIVTKLFNIVRPDTAYFGQKDAQQAIVIKKMVRDLDMDLKIKVMPIVREPGGLAMSSRNKYLSGNQRQDAAVLYDSLKLAKSLIRNGTNETGSIKSEMKSMIRRKRDARIEYISISDPDNLRELKLVKNRALIALAVRMGKTRLIDNVIVGGKI